MSYFKEVEFKLPEDPGENLKPVVQFKFNKERLDVAVDKIKQEFDKIRKGESEFTPYAIDPGTSGS